MKVHIGVTDWSGSDPSKGSMKYAARHFGKVEMSTVPARGDLVSWHEHLDDGHFLAWFSRVIRRDFFIGRDGVVSAWLDVAICDEDDGLEEG